MVTRLSVRREVGEFRKRYKWMALCAVIGFGAVIVRLVQLQVLEYDTWAQEATRNVTRHMRLPASRGLIYDTQGEVVATNRASYDIYLTPQLLDPSDLALLGKLLRLDATELADLKQRVADVPARRRGHLIEMFTDVDRDAYGAILTHARELTGVRALAVPVRTYPFKRRGGHAIGFLNEVSAEDIKAHPERKYRPGELTGRGGVEDAWESYLRGTDGSLEVVLDPHAGPSGTPADRVTKRTEPLPGRSLQLTLDMSLMRSVERAFRGHPAGAAVVIETHTGKVRALFSKPSFDLNEMTGGVDSARLREIEADPFRPLIDRTLYESYFPGSTFKPFSALTALREDLVAPTTRYECPGHYELGKRRFRCSNIHGEVDMRAAIVESCNVYFWKLAEVVGLDRLAALSRDFGFGSVTGIGINTEATGFVPTRDWYKKRHGDRYHLGFTLNAVIGQGNTKVTLVQLAAAYAALANGGTLYVPQLVEAITMPDGEIIEEFAPRVRRRLNVDPEDLRYLIDAMHGVVNDAKGTAFEAHIEGGVALAGKTGTAQVAHRELPAGADPKRAWYYRRSHAWFAGFAPADAPELAVVVLVEHGGHGGKYAAPIAVQVMQERLGTPVAPKRATARKGTHTATAPTKRGPR
jgi:penicillin-binding protein 2